MGSDPFGVWRRRRQAGDANATLIELYRLVADPRGLAAHELSREERDALWKRAAPVIWPGYQVPAGTERSESEPVEIVQYDSAWASQFQRWRDRLAASLGDAATRVEHVGSTSVPGLAAKPVVDISITVADPEQESSYVPPIEALGLQLRSRDDFHRFFRPFAGRPRDVQVHVSATHSDWERRHLLFRDYLRAHEDARNAYLVAKLDAAERWRDDRIAYADAKTLVINRLMDEAESWAVRTDWTP